METGVSRTDCLNSNPRSTIYQLIAKCFVSLPQSKVCIQPRRFGGRRKQTVCAFNNSWCIVIFEKILALTIRAIQWFFKGFVLGQLISHLTCTYDTRHWSDLHLRLCWKPFAPFLKAGLCLKCFLLFCFAGKQDKVEVKWVNQAGCL